MGGPVLSFDTTHAITGCLMHAEADAHLRGWGAPPVLLVLHDQPCPPGRQPLRRMRALSLTLDPTDVAQHPAGIPGLLHALADHLATTGPPHDTVGAAARPAAIRAEILAAPPARLLAWAVGYEDLHINADAETNVIGEVRRVDAVDIDGRVYQLTRHRGEPAVVVLIDDQPDPADTPATHPGLTALLAATEHLTGRGTEEDTRERARP
jgi:hypothetical protein